MDGRITIDSAQMGGLPCIRGMRVTVSAVIGQLAAGRSVDDVLADYPYLERSDVYAALEFAAAAVSERELSLPAGDCSSTPTYRPSSTQTSGHFSRGCGYILSKDADVMKERGLPASGFRGGNASGSENNPV